MCQTLEVDSPQHESVDMKWYTTGRPDDVSSTGAALMGLAQKGTWRLNSSYSGT